MGIILIQTTTLIQNASEVSLKTDTAMHVDMHCFLFSLNVPQISTRQASNTSMM